MIDIFIKYKICEEIFCVLAIIIAWLYVIIENRRS